MRITIKTPKGRKVGDRDIKALYLLVYALDNQSTPAMKEANLRYIADRLGYDLIKRDDK